MTSHGESQDSSENYEVDALSDNQSNNCDSYMEYPDNVRDRENHLSSFQTEK